VIASRDLERRLAASPVLVRIARACSGVEVFLTGGSLRDRLLGFPTHDLDLVVCGDGAACARAVARELQGRRFSLGRPPNVTHRIVTERLQIDLWEAAVPLRDDILRRDFTVNALFWRLPRGPLIDLAGGLEDLHAGRIRVVRIENLADDPLRVLRGVRLLATRPQLRMTAATERHLAAAAAGLRRVAVERVRSELLGLLGGPGVRRALLATARLGLLAPLLPAWRHAAEVEALAALAESLERLARSTSPALSAGARTVSAAVLAAPAAGFPSRWDEPAAAAELRRLGLGRATAQRVAAAAAAGERLAPVLGRDWRAAHELAVDAGPQVVAATAWAVARAAAAGRHLKRAATALLRWCRAFDRLQPLVDGEELASVLGLPPDESRREAVRALRLARARGETRSRRAALELIASRFSR